MKRIEKFVADYLREQCHFGPAMTDRMILNQCKGAARMLEDAYRQACLDLCDHLTDPAKRPNELTDYILALPDFDAPEHGEGG